MRLYTWPMVGLTDEAGSGAIPETAGRVESRTGTSSSSRHVKEGNTKEEAFTDVSMLSR